MMDIATTQRTLKRMQMAVMAILIIAIIIWLISGKF